MTHTDPTTHHVSHVLGWTPPERDAAAVRALVARRGEPPETLDMLLGGGGPAAARSANCRHGGHTQCRGKCGPVRGHAPCSCPCHRGPS